MENWNERKTTNAKDAFSAESKAEAVAKFAEAMNLDDVDGFVFGVSSKNGLATGAAGNKPIVTYILSGIFAEARLDPHIFMEGAFLHTLRIAAEGKEAGND